MSQDRPTTLGEPEEQFRLMVENSHDILTIRDADGRIRYASPSLQRVLGYRHEEMIGSTGFELLHPEDRSATESAMQEFWKTPGARGSIQYRARHANGSWVSLEVVAYNLLDHPGVRGVVINGRDISQRKSEEASKDQLISELKQTLAGLNTLTGVLPICASCKKIQSERGNWQQIEVYIRDRAQVEFSHGMCPECASLWFPDHAGQ
jgi:PAS domain S-box-containing protein